VTVNETTYVAYLIAPARATQGAMLFSQQALAQQEKRIQDFMQQHPGAKILKTFIESSELSRPRHRWPVLEEAVSFCLEHQTPLLIAEIRNLTSNDAFAKLIHRLLGTDRARSDAAYHHGDIYCCDQPFITKDSFAALAEHAKQQKILHGELIKAGLSRTTAKSGNPHASDVITKVNKPKIDNAIVYALMLQPIIADYQERGYSQRKMVSALNEEGFTAPEGGHWVLSQLQKVIERIRMNEAALSLEQRFLEYRARHYDDATIADMINKLSIPSPKGKEWDEQMVIKVSERIKQIHEIIRFNEFVIELMPILEKYHVDQLTPDTLMSEIEAAGVVVPQLENNMRMP